MIHFNFIASNTFDLKNFKGLESFINSYPDFQTIFLNDENELKLLLELIGIKDFDSQEINSSEFTKYWDLSNFKLPEYNEKEFDQFYEKWIKSSSRSNNMDEYGSLIFLQGLSKKWNSLNYRFVVKESKSN